MVVATMAAFFSLEPFVKQTEVHLAVHSALLGMEAPPLAFRTIDAALALLVPHVLQSFPAPCSQAPSASGMVAFSGSLVPSPPPPLVVNSMSHCSLEEHSQLSGNLVQDCSSAKESSWSPPLSAQQQSTELCSHTEQISPIETASTLQSSPRAHSSSLLFSTPERLDIHSSGGSVQSEPFSWAAAEERDNAIHQSLVAKVKDIQRSGGQQSWQHYLVQRKRSSLDPARHPAKLLNDFIYRWSSSEVSRDSTLDVEGVCNNRSGIENPLPCSLETVQHPGTEKNGQNFKSYSMPSPFATFHIVHPAGESPNHHGKGTVHVNTTSRQQQNSDTMEMPNGSLDTAAQLDNIENDTATQHDNLENESDITFGPGGFANSPRLSAVAAQRPKYKKTKQQKHRWVNHATYLARIEKENDENSASRQM